MTAINHLCCWQSIAINPSGIYSASLLALGWAAYRGLSFFLVFSLGKTMLFLIRQTRGKDKMKLFFFTHSNLKRYVSQPSFQREYK